MARIINISLKSQNWKHMTASLSERLSTLSQMCADTFVQSAVDNNPLHIVVVPEYFFRKSPAEVAKKLKDTFHGYSGMMDQTNALTQAQLDQFKGQKRKHTMYTAAEKDLIVAALLQLTAGSNTVIVAGTVFWAEREPVVRGGSLFRSQQIVIKGIARNTCFIAHNGNLLATYHKNIDREELDTLERSTFTYVGGTSSPDVVADGIRIGVEICADHDGVHTIINRIDAGTLNHLDVHIIISDGAAPVGTRIGTHADGVILHCDVSSSQALQLGTVEYDATDFQGNAVKATRPFKNQIAPHAQYIRQSLVLASGTKLGKVYGPTLPN